MRSIITTLCALLASSVMSCADDWIETSNTRVWIQFIALPYATLTELLEKDSGSDAALHREVMAMTKNGKAKILETGMVTGAEGENPSVESILEDIYPTEYDPPGLNGQGLPTRGPMPRKFESMYWPRSINCTAFETRNIGFTIEFEATVPYKNHISLRIVPEIVQRLHYESWYQLEDAWGEIDVKFPIYETWRGNQAVLLKPGSPSLLFNLSPKRQVLPPYEDSRILVFARADILSP